MYAELELFDRLKNYLLFILQNECGAVLISKETSTELRQNLTTKLTQNF